MIKSLFIYVWMFKTNRQYKNVAGKLVVIFLDV